MKGGTGNIVIKNKKASHDYEFLEKFIAGIKLSGTEIKSLRLGEFDVLVGINLLREGLDIPEVSLVAVLGIFSLLYFQFKG